MNEPTNLYSDHPEALKERIAQLKEENDYLRITVKVITSTDDYHKEMPMTREEMMALQPGDIIRHASGSPSGVLVTQNTGNSILGVTQHHITNPPEWVLVEKALRMRPPF